MKKNLLFVFALFTLTTQAQNTDTIVRLKSANLPGTVFEFETLSVLYYVDPKEALPNPEDINRDSNGQDSGESYYFNLGNIADSSINRISDTVITTTLPFLMLGPGCSSRYGNDFELENIDILDYKGTEAEIIQAVEGSGKENSVIPGTTELKTDPAPNGTGYSQPGTTPKVKKGRFRTGPQKMAEKQSIIRH